MDIKKAKAILEAILFTMGASVSLDVLAQAVEQDRETTQRLLHTMMDEYAAAGRGIRLIELEDSFQMCSNPDYYEYLIRVASQPKKYALTDVLLETLSIVAYRQPIAKAEIEAIRGVNSDHAVSRLVEYDLIEEVGRLNAPGRPILFGTTEAFLRHFGIGSLEELPEIGPEQMEEFKQEAEEEIQLRLDI
ncbi:MAG: SMC-Scp complex subunit ScpB [Lachnospiraceae bacterium]|nr:SMC-Scp complex subunit ScpB [Lachnospiraceae bacterium]